MCLRRLEVLTDSHGGPVDKIKGGHTTTIIPNAQTCIVAAVHVVRVDPDEPLSFIQNSRLNGIVDDFTH